MVLLAKLGRKPRDDAPTHAHKIRIRMSATDLEKAETLKELLVSYATGKPAEDVEYLVLRKVLMSNKHALEKLPDFVISCQNLSEFWDFIKSKYKTYKERRIFLRQEFTDILRTLASLGEETVSMYELVQNIEKNLHKAIREALVNEYGSRKWWREGIPVGIRQELVSRREADPEPGEEPYNYTTLIHLKEICDKRWAVVSSTFLPEIRADKRKFLTNMTKLNQIRNKVMHPVKGPEPGQDDIRFVQSFKESLGS